MASDPQSLVAITPYSATDASSRARVHHWLDRTGISALRFVTGSIAPAAVANALKEARRSSRPLLLARHAHPLGQGWPEMALLKAGNPGIYDLDDGLPFDNGRLPEHARWWKPLVAKSRIAARSARSAQRIIVGNDYLAQWAANFCRDVVVIPTCVEPADYQKRANFERRGIPVVGWMGSPATEPHLFGIADALARAHSRSPFTLEIVSAGQRPLPGPLAAFARRTEWDLATQHSVAQHWDVGLMPLPDHEYERSKCAYKLLQYGASAIPVIGSPVGASAAFLSKVGAPAPRTSGEWTDAVIEMLALRESDRQRFGRRTQIIVERDYSYSAWESTWRAAVGH
jgi:glycosyltransferase involved in cell wall biosynthesis